MDIRVVETLKRSGVLSDSRFSLDGTKELVSLDWSYKNNTFSVIDRNINYALLPFTIESQLVKKVFLTYNGISDQNQEILETVVMESANTADADYYPGYNNSNEWIYTPANFKIPVDPTGLNSNDLLVWPYPYSDGVTLIKQFLNAESNVYNPLYTAYYRRPTMTFYEMANVENNKVYTDGWYTSYVIAAKTYASAVASPGGIALNDIVFYPANNKFYVNITGIYITSTEYTFSYDTELNGPFQVNENITMTSPTATGKLTALTDNGTTGTMRIRLLTGTVPTDNTVITGVTSGATCLVNGTVTAAPYLPVDDTTNWRPDPSFIDWQTLMLSNYQDITPSMDIENPEIQQEVSPSNKLYYIESNHMATPELNRAVLNMLKKICSVCDKKEFGMSHIEDWIKLCQKRTGAFVYFNQESFKECQRILASSRSHCDLALYGKNCNFNYNFPYNTKC